jgi:uncharacterized protein (UPF0335 family)
MKMAKRGRPPGSTNKKKGGDADSAPAPAVGHNSGQSVQALNEDQQRALYLQNIGKIERLKEAATSAAGALRQAYQTAKADGFSKQDIDWGIRLRKVEEKETLEDRRRQALLAKFLNHPIGTQPDMFDGVDRTPSVDKAREHGKMDGMEGKPLTPPSQYTPGTEQYESYCEGWHDGQAVLGMKGFKKTEQVPEGEFADPIEQPDDDTDDKKRGIGAAAAGDAFLEDIKKEDAAPSSPEDKFADMEIPENLRRKKENATA